MVKSVLVADDNPVIRRILCRIFEAEEDYDLCAEAENGEEALRLAKKCKPDLIILDLSMPVMNGIDAARELKRIMPQVPIVLFTLHAEAVTHHFSRNDAPVDLVVAKSDASNIISHVRSLTAS